MKNGNTDMVARAGVTLLASILALCIGLWVTRMNNIADRVADFAEEQGKLTGYVECISRHLEACEME